MTLYLKNTYINNVKYNTRYENNLSINKHIVLWCYSIMCTKYTIIYSTQTVLKYHCNPSAENKLNYKPIRNVTTNLTTLMRTCERQYYQLDQCP